jgi:hypothetical protein
MIDVHDHLEPIFNVIAKLNLTHTSRIFYASRRIDLNASAN